MKNRNPYLPLFITFLSIASIGALYGKTLQPTKTPSSTDEFAPISVELKGVSHMDLLSWMAKHQIQYVTEHPRDNEDQEYSVYFDHASQQDVVNAMSKVLETNWKREGNVYVLSPRVQPASPKSSSRSDRATSQNQSLSVPTLQPMTSPVIDGEPQTFASTFIATVTTDQMQRMDQLGFLPTSDLTENQKKLIRAEITSKDCRILVCALGKVIKIQGAL